MTNSVILGVKDHINMIIIMSIVNVFYSLASVFPSSGDPPKEGCMQLSSSLHRGWNASGY